MVIPWVLAGSFFLWSGKEALLNWDPDLLELLGMCVLTSLMMGLGIFPTTFLSFLSGYYFGFWGGVVSTGCYIVASVLGYGLGRLLDQGKLEKLLNQRKRMRDFIDRFHKNDKEMIFWSRLSPVIPFGLMNFTFAYLKVPLKHVLVYGTLGMLPRALSAVWIGTQAQDLLAALSGKGNPAWWPIVTGVLVLLTIGMMGKRLSPKKEKTSLE